jgi:hypothetical protein
MCTPIGLLRKVSVITPDNPQMIHNKKREFIPLAALIARDILLSLFQRIEPGEFIGKPINSALEYLQHGNIAWLKKAIT